jgi:hypothetical protein
LSGRQPPDRSSTCSTSVTTRLLQQTSADRFPYCTNYTNIAVTRDTSVVQFLQEEISHGNTAAVAAVADTAPPSSP